MIKELEFENLLDKDFIRFSTQNNSIDFLLSSIRVKVTNKDELIAEFPVQIYVSEKNKHKL